MVRWDRIARLALLTVLGIIVLLYVPPVTHWVVQSQTAAEHEAELRRLEGEHARLSQRAEALQRPDALEQEARKLGMVRTGERAFVVEQPPAP